MIKEFHVQNFGCIDSIRVENLKGINLIVGPNSCGKSTLLKVLYAAKRSAELFQRGKNDESYQRLLHKKLRWTFQVDSLQSLIKRDASLSANVQFKADKAEVNFSIAKKKEAPVCSPFFNKVKPTPVNSVFLPAKEILSLQRLVIKTHDLDMEFGFDETYYDLAMALNSPTTKGKNPGGFANSRKMLKDITGGVVSFDAKENRWFLKKDGHTFPIELASDGIKKIGILDTLLGNRFLTKSSVVFIDELESSLHPTAISKFLDIVYELSACGVQFIISSHSYFVVKKLYLLAQKNRQSIPIISLDGGYRVDDLLDGIPEDNQIIAESIRLYEEEIDL